MKKDIKVGDLVQVVGYEDALAYAQDRGRYVIGIVVFMPPRCLNARDWRLGRVHGKPGTWCVIHWNCGSTDIWGLNTLKKVEVE